MSTSKLLQRKLARDCELEFRVYSFRELASLYFPHYQPSSASRALRQLITHDALFKRQLQRRGFSLTRCTISPYQIEIVLQQLGTPREFYEIQRANSPY